MELQRVAHAGYIEVPDAFMERVNPYRDHRLEITLRDRTLVIRKKTGWRHDPGIVELYEDRVKSIITGEVIPKHPFAFHVRYYWQDRIAFTVVNPDADAGWLSPVGGSDGGSVSTGGARAWLRERLHGLSSQHRRNAQIDVLKLMRCPSCGSEALQRKDTSLTCAACQTRFPLRRGIPVMNEPVRPS